MLCICYIIFPWGIRAAAKSAMAGFGPGIWPGPGFGPGIGSGLGFGSGIGPGPEFKHGI